MGKMTSLFKASGGAMELLDQWTKDVVPKNEVSQFIEDNFGNLFLAPKESKESGVAAGLLVKMMIDESNSNPDFVMSKLTSFTKAYAKFYKSKQKDVDY